MKADKLQITEEELVQLEETLLVGEINPLREYVITLGQSGSSKGAMFVFYSYLRQYTSAYVNPANYLGILGADIKTAVINARKRCPKFQIKIEEYETFNQRCHPCTMPFGKYKGMKIEDIFDQDEKYLFWLSNSDSVNYIKSEASRNMIIQYAEIAKENIVAANKEASNPALELETALVERKLTIYDRKLKEIEVSYNYNGTDSVWVYKAKDEFGNKFYYTGNSGKFYDAYENKVELIVKCRVSGSFESLGVTFNKIKLTKGK